MEEINLHEFEDNNYIINIIVIDIELVSHMIYLLSQKFIIRTYAFDTKWKWEKFGSYQELKFSQYSQEFLPIKRLYEQKGKIIAVIYVYFIWKLVYLVKKSSVKKMEIIYCNCLSLTHPIKAFISNPRRKKKLFLLYFQKNFNKLCFKLHSLYNNLCERKEIERTFFFKNFEIVNSVLFSIESRDQNETWNFF